MLIGYASGFVLAVIPAVVGLIIVTTRGHGRARSIGMIGFAVAAGLGILTQSVNILLPRILATMGSSLAVLTTSWGIIVMILHAVEMIILALAIVANRPTAPQQQPTAHGYNQSATLG